MWLRGGDCGLSFLLGLRSFELVGEDFEVGETFLFAEGAFGVIFFADERAVFERADGVAEDVIEAVGREDNEIIVLVEADAETGDGLGHGSNGGFDAGVGVDGDVAIIWEPEVGAGFVGDIEREVNVGQGGFDEFDN